MKLTVLIRMVIILMCIILAFVLPSCSGNDKNDGTTTEDITTGEQTGNETTVATDAGTTGVSGGDTTDINTDNQTENDTTGVETTEYNDGTLCLSDGGHSDYRIIVSEYAATWEKEAADAIATLISGAVVYTDKEQPSENEILVGYTSREDNPNEDFTKAEKDGYVIGVRQNTITLAFNSAGGAGEAVAAFEGALVKSNERIGIKPDTRLEKAYTMPEKQKTDIGGEWGDTISYANEIKNSMESAYTDSSRRVYALSNLDFSMQYRLATADTPNVTEFLNSDGVPYIKGSFDAYLKDSAGNFAYASNSVCPAHVNTYRLGYYYHDVHFIDQTFSGNNDGIKLDDVYDILGNSGRWSSNMTSIPKIGEDGILRFTVNDTYDPYVVAGKCNFDTAKYNALRIVMRASDATTAQIYFVAGSHSGFSADQLVTFSVTRGNEFAEYYIPLSNAEDYTGKVRSIRLDIGGKVGEVIEIKSIEAVSMNVNSPKAAMDRIYHTYPDKLYEELHIVSTGDTSDISACGVEVKIEKTRVLTMLVGDDSGIHEGLDGVDRNSIGYIAFDIVRAGIIGFISPGSRKGDISVTEADGYYIVRIEQEFTAQAKGDEFNMGYRIYTDNGHEFSKFLNEAYTERHPLVGITVGSNADHASYAGYDELRGCYTYTVDGTDFNIYYKDPQRQYKINTTISGDGYNRKLYVLAATKAGCLESAAMLDENELLLPVPIEVCKNFCGEMEEAMFNIGDISYGEAIIPLSVGVGEERTFTMIHLYQNWGNYALKQISSIQFIAPYYHLSSGTTETNCIAPYFVYGKDFWTLPDFRAMSAPFWSGQPQHTSVGRLYFLRYTDADGGQYGSEFVSDQINSYGPVYADIDMQYLSDDGKIKAEYRHLELPQRDENRTYYEVKLTVLDDVKITDFKKDFSFFSFDGRAILFSKAGYLNENNQCVTEELNLSKPFEEYITLGKNCPYFGYYDANANDYVNFALFVKNSTVKINGQTVENPFVIRNVYNGTLNYCYLTMDLGSVTLTAGDTVTIDLILLPWGSQLSTDDTNMRDVRNDSCLVPFFVTAEKGKVISDDYMPMVEAEDNVAEFTVGGGSGNCAVRVYGFSQNCKPQIYEKVNGEWKEYDYSHYDYDGYNVYYDGDGKFSYAFAFDMTNKGTRSFKVICD